MENTFQKYGIQMVERSTLKDTSWLLVLISLFPVFNVSILLLFRNYAIVLRQKDLITVNKKNGKIKKIFTIEETPVDLRSFSDWCFVLLEDGLFHFM